MVQSTDQVWKSPAQVWANHSQGRSSSRIPAMIIRANAIVELNIQPRPRHLVSSRGLEAHRMCREQYERYTDLLDPPNQRAGFRFVVEASVLVREQQQPCIPSSHTARSSSFIDSSNF